MKIANFTHRLVKAGRIKSPSEVKMIALEKEAYNKKLSKPLQKDRLLFQAQSIFNHLPKAIKSLY